MAYVHWDYIAIVAMIRHMFHLHKTHDSYNKRQKQYGIDPKKETMLCYAILCAIEI
jgi:hypothetical protein